MKLYEVEEFNKVKIPDNKEVWLDLGCGKGHFLRKLAMRYPEKFFIGIDYSGKVAQSALDKIKRGNIKNAVVFRGCFKELVDKFKAVSLEKVFVVCPDPWFKNKHRKRRTVTQEFLEKIYNKLIPGGEFIFITDFGPYTMTVVKEEYDKFINPYFPHMWIHTLRGTPYSTYMEKSLDSDGRIYFFRRIKSI